MLFCLWAEAYRQMGATRTLMYGALSCIAAAAASFLISTMEAPFGVIATALLPLASLACAHLSFRLLPTERAVAKGVHYPIPWKLIVIMAIAGLLSSFSGAFLSATEYVGAIHRVAATGIVGVVILVMAVSKRDRFDARFLAKVGLPVAVVAFAVIPFVAPMQGYIVSVLMRFAYVWFTFFVLLMLANICYRFEIPSLRLFAIARASSEAALLAGILVRRALWQTDLLADPTTLAGFALAGIVLVLVCVVIWMSEKSVNGDWGASGLSLADRLHVPGPRERFMSRCDDLAAQYDLTARETEIMGLIAQRKSRAEIEPGAVPVAEHGEDARAAPVRQAGRALENRRHRAVRRVRGAALRGPSFGPGKNTPQRANACFSGEDVSRRGRSCKPRPCYDAALWHAS